METAGRLRASRLAFGGDGMANLKEFHVQVGSKTVGIYAENLDDLIAKLADKSDGEWMKVDRRGMFVRKDAVDIIYTGGPCYL